MAAEGPRQSDSAVPLVVVVKAAAAAAAVVVTETADAVAPAAPRPRDDELLCRQRRRPTAVEARWC